MKKNFLISALLLLSAGAARSQIQSDFPAYTPNVMPPSPDAFNFTKYGSLPIGLNTGTAQFSLPVYEIQSGSLKHGVSIGYSSNGVKVDEMATRVGINWTLRAGGMITRRVIDKPDGAPGIQPIFYHGNANPNQGNWDLYNFVRHAAEPLPPDYQPDEYSFNMDGYSGTFMKRETGEFAQFGSSAIKIEQGSGGFILTAPTGTKYFFGLSETVWNYPYENTSLSITPAEVPTSWYLTKILSNSKDSIVFNYLPVVTTSNTFLTYRNGISQDYNTVLMTNPSGGAYANYIRVGYNGEQGPSFPACYPIPANAGITNTVQLTQNLPNYLSSIQFNNGHVDFLYSEREDVPGEKKLDTIKVISNKDGSIASAYALNYTYANATSTVYDTYTMPDVNYTSQFPELRKRLFLNGFTHLSNTLQTGEAYHFEYEDMNGLPPRLSFAQDRFGAFNAKSNGLYFIPNDTWLDKYIGNNRFGADRSYNFAAAQKGMLRKIIYPAGGYTQFNYEPNKTENDYAYFLRKDSASALIDTSTYSGQEAFSANFYVDQQKELHVHGWCDWASTPVSTSENGHDIDIEDAYKAVAFLLDANDNIIWTGIMLPQQSFTDGNFGLTLPIGYYHWKLVADRPRLKAKIVLEHWWKENDRTSNSGIAGVRVKSISDFIMANNEFNKREFIYGNWGDTSSTNCSGTGIVFGVNHGNEISAVRTTGFSYGEDPGNPASYLNPCGYNTIHSNSVLTNFVTDNNTVIYKKVIELNTVSNSTKNNGGTEHEFFYEPKKYPVPLTFNWPTYGEEIQPIIPSGAPFMNNDFITGKEKSTRVFTYQQPTGTRQVLEESFNYYSVDTPHLVIDTFLLSRWTGINGFYNNVTYFGDYDIYKEWRYFGLLKMDSTLKKTYTPEGNIVNTVSYQNYSPTVYRPRDLVYYSSKGEQKKLSRIYYGDVQGPMQALNMKDILLEEKASKGTTELSKKLMVYTNQFDDPAIYSPALVQSSLKGETPETDVTYDRYDSKGNLLQYTGKDGVTTAVLWGYHQQYPVAKIAGKSYADALSQSGISLTVLNDPASDAAMRTELLKLTSLSGCITSGATYKPLVGVTSEINANGKVSYYEYDEFNRLKLIRDQDNNILKRYCYNYQGQQTDCTETIVFTGATGAECNTTNCAGPDKKCINGTCQTSIKYYTSSVRTGPRTWECTYYYHWSDGSSSPTYTETNSSYCLLIEPF